MSLLSFLNVDIYKSQHSISKILFNFRCWIFDASLDLNGLFTFAGSSLKIDAAW